MPKCTTDADCKNGNVCVNHMWAYNGQHESGKGCWDATMCAGNGSYLMFDERKIQWFCSEEQTSAADTAAKANAFNLKQADAKHWDEFKVSCKL